MTDTRSRFNRETRLPNGDILTANVVARSAPGRYLSITGEIRRPRAREAHTVGCIHDQILKAWPDLAPLVRWHLSDDTGTPMHYLANGMYWWEISVGLNTNTPHGPDPVEAFKSTVVWGALGQDAGLEPWRHGPPNCEADREELAITRRDVGRFLLERLPALRAAFFADLAAFNLAFV
jgi:hypothetical protein